MINTCNPIWSQSFVYAGIRAVDLVSRVLEVTVWDYDRYGANEFLGEVTIDLGAAARASAAGLTLEGLEATWHALTRMQNGSDPAVSSYDRRHRDGRTTPNYSHYSARSYFIIPLYCMYVVRCPCLSRWKENDFHARYHWTYGMACLITSFLFLFLPPSLSPSNSVFSYSSALIHSPLTCVDLNCTFPPAACDIHTITDRM